MTASAGWRDLRLRQLALVTTLAGLALACAPAAPAAATTSPGQLYSFGNNQYGQLGFAATGEGANPTPTLVTLPGATGPVIEAAVGFHHSLALTSTGQLFSFGENKYGQLGNTTNEGTVLPNATPTLVALPGATGPIVQIAAGEYHSLALTSTGQLFAWGQNRYGQLGNTTHVETETGTPTPTLVTLPGATGPVIQAVAGFSYSLALTSTGQLFVFGSNLRGQLGNTTNVNTSKANATPTLLTLPGATGQIREIAAGAFHTLVLTSTGQLFAWGENQFGQLGNTTNNEVSASNPTPTPVAVPGANGPIMQIGTPSFASLAATSGGQLFSFGENTFGELGLTANSGTEKPTPTPTAVTLPGASGGAAEVAGGEFHSLVLTSSGQLFAFGNNDWGQLANTTNNGTEAPNPSPSLVALPGGGTIDSVARGSDANHTLVIVADLAVSPLAPAAGTVGTAFSASPTAGGGRVPYTWSATTLPPGLAIDPATGAIAGTPTTAGTYTGTLTTTDTDGVAASAPFTIVVQPIPVPALTSASQSARRWREGKALARLSSAHARRKGRHRLPVGTTFSFRLSEAATVTLSFTEHLAGRRVGHRCAPLTRTDRRRRGCPRAVTVGMLRLAGHGGLDKVRFDGRLSRSKRLRPGRYTVTIEASTRGGHSKPANLSFTIVG